MKYIIDIESSKEAVKHTRYGYDNLEAVEVTKQQLFEAVSEYLSTNGFSTSRLSFTVGGDDDTDNE